MLQNTAGDVKHHLFFTGEAFGNLFGAHHCNIAVVIPRLIEWNIARIILNFRARDEFFKLSRHLPVLRLLCVL